MPPRKLKAALLFIFIVAILRIIGFDFQVTAHREQSSGRTSDSLDIRGIRKSFRILFDAGKEAGNSKLFGTVTLALTTSETGNFTNLAFIRTFFRIVAINVNISSSRNKFDNVAGTDGDTSSATDTKFRMDNSKIIDDLNGSERTLAGTASHTDTSVGASLGTACNQYG